MSDLTPAQELREAAMDMRAKHGPGHVRHAFWHALADLLEAEAFGYAPHDASTQAFMAGDQGGDLDPAIAVTRAYGEC